MKSNHIIELHQRGGQRLYKPFQGTLEEANNEAQAQAVDPSIVGAYVYKMVAGYQPKVIAEKIEVPAHARVAN
jgi:hypothetical protein